MLSIRRFPPIAAAMFLLVLAALIIAPRLDRGIHGGMDRVLGLARHEAENATGLGISFESLSPSILSSLTISNLVLRNSRGGRVLEARRVDVYYDLWSMLSGRGMAGVSEIRIEGASLDLEFPVDNAMLETLARRFAPAGSGALPHIVVSGRELAVRVAVEGSGTYAFNADRFSYSTLGEEMELQLKGRAVAESAGALGRVEAQVELSGMLAKDLERARLSLSFSANSKDIQLATQRFELVYADHAVELLKVRDKAPLDASLRYNFRDGGLNASLRLDNYPLRRSVSLSGSLAAFRPWLESPYTGSLTLSLPAGEVSKISYDINLEGTLPPNILPRRYRTSLSAHGDSRSMAVEHARLEEGDQSFEYSGSLQFADMAPDGELSVRFSLLGGKLPVSSRFRLQGHGGEFAALSEGLTVGGVGIDDLALSAAYRRRQIEFGLSFRPPEAGEASPDLPATRFSGEAGTQTGALPRVFCEGSVNLEGKSSLDVAIDLEEVDLNPLRPILEALLPGREMAGLVSQFKIGGEFYVATDFEALSWSASDLAVVSRTAPGAYALLSLSGNLQTIEVKNATLAIGGYTIEGKGSLDIAGQGRLGFETSFKLKDIPYQLRGFLVENGLFISGDYGLEVSARSEGDQTYVKARSHDLPFPAGGGVVLATLDADARFASPKDWSVALAVLSIVPAGERFARIPSVSLSGLIDQDSGDIPRISIGDKTSTLSGSLSFGYDLTKGMVARASARLKAQEDSPNPAESYSIDASYADASIDARIDFSSSPLSRFMVLPFAGSVDGSARLQGPLGRPLVGFKMRLRDVKVEGEPVSLSAEGDFDWKSIRLAALAARFKGQEISSGSASVSLEDASSSIRLSFKGNLGGESISFDLAAEGSSAEASGSQDVQLANYALRGTIEGLKYGAVNVALWPFLASRSPSGLSLRAGEAAELVALYRADGSFSVLMKDPLPLHLSAEGRVAGTAIDASVTGIEADLGALGNLLPPGVFRLKGGSASGALSIRGLVSDPEINGSIDLKAAVCTVKDYVADPIGPFDGPIIAQGRTFAFFAPSSPVGPARVSIRAGAGLDHWLPTDLKVTVNSVEATSLRADLAISGVKVQGETTLDFDLELRGDVLDLVFNCFLTKATVVIGPRILDQSQGQQVGAGGARSGPLVNITATVRPGRGVQIFFPSQDIPIVSGFAEPTSSLVLRYDQATDDFSAKGSVGIRGGTVFYIQRDFFLRSGRMVFNEAGGKFDPLVTLLAELRDRTDTGPVLITLRADNAPISNFKPRLSSDPVMTEAQIASLLGENLLGKAPEEQVDLRKAVISTSEFIPQLNVSKAFERRVRDSLGLDVFFLHTEVLQRWLIDLSGPTSTSAVDPLGRYLDQTALYAGKYVADSVFVHGSARLREDPLVRSSGLRLDSELGLEFDTPFGLVQWSIAPSRPENLFISDQSLSITWRLSY